MEDLKHTGTPRHSGRYPYGSGKDPAQRTKSWLDQVHELHKQGLTDLEIAKGQGMSLADLRKKRTIEIAAVKKERTAFAQRLKDKGWSYTAIGERMGLNDHTVAALLDPVVQERVMITENVANALEVAVAKLKNEN